MAGEWEEGGEASGEGVGLGVGRIDGGAPDVDGGGVLWSSDVCVMSLCRRKLHDGGILQFLGLMVRPLGPATLTQNPKPPSPKGPDYGYEEDHLATEEHHLNPAGSVANSASPKVKA
jgi:hypothetical protein